MKIQPTMSVFSYSIRRNELQTNKNYAMRRNLTSSYVEALSFKGNPFANTAVKGFRNIQGLLCDESGKVTDIIAGTCFICDSKEDEFIGLSEKQTEEYLKRFKYPEKFYRTGDGITKVPYNPNKNKDYER